MTAVQMGLSPVARAMIAGSDRSHATGLAPPPDEGLHNCGIGK